MAYNAKGIQIKIAGAWKRSAPIAVLPTVMVLLSVLMHLFPGVPAFVPIALYAATFFSALAFTIYDYVHKVTHDMSYALCCPLSLSIFMNLFLSGIAHEISNSIAALLLSSNILYAFVVAAVAACIELSHRGGSQIGNLIVALLCVLMGYAVLLYILHPSTITSFVSTLRNLITPFCFFLLGAVLAERVTLDSFCDLVIALGFLVIAFGFVECFVFPDFWVKANIHDLWGLKGIKIPVSQPPSNFYSSETINGVHMRRMASLFADPVNLGAFLFCVFMAAWYRRRWFMVVLAVVSCALTVSKGALLGFLVWIFLYFLITSENVWVKRAALFSVFAIGIGFLGFSAVSSTGSVAAHMRGALGGLESIINNPFGYGCGNVGVLASLANNHAMRGVEESGFGVIAGEVGIIGVAVYAIFFIVTLRSGLEARDKRVKIMVCTLLLAIFANIMFNEVALSPNSCGVYFSLLGVMLGDSLPHDEPEIRGAHFAHSDW